MSVHGPILRSLLRNAHRTLVIDDRRRWNGAMLLGASMRLAEELDARGAPPMVGVMLPPSGAFPVAALAIWITGRVLVPLNFLLKPDELRYVIRNSEVGVTLTTQPLLDALDEPPDGVDLLLLESLAGGGVPTLRWPAPAGDGDLAALLYTSGTSGKPKGVMLTHGNLSSNIRQVIDWAAFTRRDVMLGVLPQFHSFGLTVLTLTPLTRGCRVVYASRFVPQRIVKMMREHRPTALVALPSMYNALLRVKRAEAEDFASLRFPVAGGEPLPDAVYDSFLDRFGVSICEGYGLTETGPVANWSLPESSRRHRVGPPLPGVEERIVDVETGRTLGPCMEGEIRIKGPNVMRGYFKLPQETAAVFDEQGFFRTGDMGMLDEVGQLAITGRIKEMLIVGGENVFPREIEEVLNAHESVRESGVVGAPDPMRGETPVAFVETADDADFDERALRAWCRERLAGYKVPRRIVRIEALPRNATGKILRRDLQRQANAGR